MKKTHIPPRSYHRPNGWGMIQNVLIASLNKGQFIIGIIGMIFIILVLKLSSSDSKLFLDEVINKAHSWYYWGWILGLISTAGWFFSTKRLRSLHEKEMKRVSDEKSKLQQNHIPKKLSSTNTKRK